MIDRRELLTLAAEFGLRPDVVEKDYVLAWVLAGIHAKPELRDAWVFKGGTCLKKCYFETYRFSEDLDFTIREPDHLDGTYLRRLFEGVADWVYKHSGIEIPPETLRFDIYTNKRGNPSCNGKLGYRGPIAPGGSLPRIKLDVTADEALVLEPVEVPISHPYSDDDVEAFQTTAYCFEEVFAEKIRALAERLRPRDLYDVINLYRHDELAPGRSLVRQTLRDKCAFKGIGYPSFATIREMPERVELEAEWANMLEHQLRELPPFEHFWGALDDFFAWLEGSRELTALGSIPSPGRVPLHVKAHRTTTRLGGHMETVGFAAANRLCVELRYDDRTRLIEPYSLRKSGSGDVLLYAVHAGTREIRSYRTDRVQGAAVSRIPFIPQFVVEISASGSVSIPRARRRVQARPAVRGNNPPRGSRSRRYVVECSYCGRRFYRKKYSTAIRPHMDRDGQACSGRTGRIVAAR